MPYQEARMIPPLATRPVMIAAFLIAGTLWCLVLTMVALAVSAVAGVCAVVDWMRRG